MQHRNNSEMIQHLPVIVAKAEGLRENLIATRRDFHTHPELSGEERRTSGIVAQWIRNLGLEVRTGVGGYGVVGILRGAQAGPVVAYRADMDAIRSEDVSEMPYRSQVEGVKHGCGHDVHTVVCFCSVWHTERAASRLSTMRQIMM